MRCWLFLKKKTRVVRNGLLLLFLKEEEEEEEEENKGAEKWVVVLKKKETRVVRNGLLLVCRPRGRGDSTVAHDIDGDQSLRVRDLQQRVSAGSEPAVTQTGP